MSNKLWDGVSRGSNSWTSRLTTYERKISPLYVGPWLGSSRWGQLGRNIQIYSCHWNCFNLIIVSVQELFLYWQQRWWWWFDETVCLTWGLLKWRCNQFVGRWKAVKDFGPGAKILSEHPRLFLGAPLHQRFVKLLETEHLGWSLTEQCFACIRQ